jgi:hypothetical protein
LTFRLSCRRSSARRKRECDLRKKGQLFFIGNSLAIDFLNTVEAISRGVNGVHFAKFKVTSDRERGRWVVMAYNEDDPQDSHTYLLIGPRGSVERIDKGS